MTPQEEIEAWRVTQLKESYPFRIGGEKFINLYNETIVKFDPIFNQLRESGIYCSLVISYGDTRITDDHLKINNLSDINWYYATNNKNTNNDNKSDHFIIKFDIDSLKKTIVTIEGSYNVLNTKNKYWFKKYMQELSNKVEHALYISSINFTNSGSSLIFSKHEI